MKESLIQRVRQRGTSSVIKSIVKRGRKLFYLMRCLGAEPWKNPTDDDIESIEREFKNQSIILTDYRIELQLFSEFKRLMAFPSAYHGGIAGGVYEEKLLEHYVAWDFLKLAEGDRYLDVAGASSPWVVLLNTKGIEAVSIDLTVPEQFSQYCFYRKGNATSTNFPDDFFDGASSQCAYELFEGDSDVKLLAEIHRILKPGGRFVIVPLYMHTHACYYQSPDYWGKPHGDIDAKAYIRRDASGIPASRKYSVQTLKDRIIQNAVQVGLQPTIYVLRNKKEIPGNIYLHFILVLDKPSILPTPPGELL